jgi:predicted phage terminase large subunit-like protein
MIGVSAEQRASARAVWEGAYARDAQIPPDTHDWSTWLILSGRGWGKTRTGAEWLVWQAVQRPGTRWAVIAPTHADTRDTAVEGVSGIRSVLDRYNMAARWNRSIGEVVLKNESRIKLFSADEPDRLRGPQHHGAWADELAAWKNPQQAWDQIRFGLRLGENPQIVVTTTPRPLALLRDLEKDPRTLVTRGSTFDNAANLSKVALDDLRAKYEGSRLGRQELFGEILTDVEGALWSHDTIDAARTLDYPPLERIVTAVDPAVTFNSDSDETGIITAGVSNGHFYVLSDATVKAAPNEWANRVHSEYQRWTADRVICETNNGGDLIPGLMRTIDPDLPIKKVTASRGKIVRAEPVAALYEQGKVHHVGYFPDLEQQMTTYAAGSKDSPDRMDALVWAITGLQERTVKPGKLLAS